MQRYMQEIHTLHVYVDIIVYSTHVKHFKTKREIMQDYKYETTPYDHQRVALEASWSADYYALFMEMGTGKSKVLIDNMAMLYLEGQINFALIIAPKGVYRNWVQREIPEHLSDDVPRRIIKWVSSPNKKQKAALRSRGQFAPCMWVIVKGVRPCN